MTGKKVVLVIKNLKTEQNDCSNLQRFVTMFCEERYSVFATWFSFSVNKKKKKYKAKFSTNLILKKRPTKIILEGEKPMRKNVVAIDNVLRGKL
jgi:hypothetical protein